MKSFLFVVFILASTLGVSQVNNSAPAVDLKILFPLPHRGPILDLAFTPDGKKIITISEDYSIKIYDIITRSVLRTISIKQHGFPLSLSILPDSKRLIYSTKTNSYVIDIETGNELKTLNGLSGRIVMNDSVITAGTFSSSSESDVAMGKQFRTRYNPDFKKADSFYLTPSEQLEETQYHTNCNSCGYDASLLSNDLLVYMNGEYLYYYNIPDAKNVDSIYINSENFNYPLCFSADPAGKRIFIHGSNGITEFNASGDSVRFIPVNLTNKKDESISAYRLYFHNGKHFICTGNGSIIIVDDRTSEILCTYTNSETIDESSEGVISLAFHPEKSIVAAGYEKKNYFIVFDYENMTGSKFENIETSQVRKLKVSENEDALYIDTRFSGTILNLNDLSKTIVLKGDHQDSDVDFTSGNIVSLSSLTNRISWNNYKNPFKKDTVRWLPAFGKKVSFLSPDTIIVSQGSGDSSGESRADVNVFSSGDILNPGYPFRYGTVYSFRSELDIENMVLFNNLIVTYNRGGDLKYLDFRKSDPVYDHSYMTDMDGNRIITSAFSLENSYRLFTERYKTVYDIDASENSKHLFILGESSFPYTKGTFVDTKTGDLFFLKDSLSAITACFLNDTVLLTGNTDGTIDRMEVNYKTKKLIAKSRVSFSESGITDIIYLHKRKQFLISTDDNKIYFTDEKLNKIVYYFATDDENFIYADTLNHYFASRDLAKNIFFHKSNKLYSFDQFDALLNRPDIIIKNLLPADSVQYKVYNELYKKRMKKAGLKEEGMLEGFDLPSLNIKDIDKIPQSTDNPLLNFSAESNGNGLKLLYVSIWINGVPVERIDCKGKKKLVKNIKLELVRGLNKIELAVTNESGLESYKETVYTNYTPKELLKSDLFLITIGDSKLKDERFNLNYASKDALDIQSFFNSNTQGIYGNVYSYSLIDENVTVENIKAIKDRLSVAKRNDIVIVTFAGHGLLDKNWDYYLATYSIDFNNPSEGGLPYGNLESLFEGIAPLKKILMIDACHSGEVDKEEMIQFTSGFEKSSSDINFRSAGSGIAKKNVSLKTSSELMKEMFADIRRGTGATVISSAAGAELAYEGDQWKNGLFTYCLLTGLKDKEADLNNDGQIYLSELQKYISEKVYLLSKGLQRPASRIENSNMDFRVW